MAKIPFSIEHREKIESGEYKVKTRDGRTARIICWDRRGERPLVVLVQNLNGYDEGLFYYDNGLADGVEQEHDNDLFLVTPEPELTEFEKELESFYNHHLQVCTYDNQGTVEDSLHDGASKLLAIARKQLIKDGYVIEKKAFHDAVENISDKHLAEMSVQYSIHCKVENGTRHAIMNWDTFQKVAQKFIDIGKEEALKDLPRWKKATRRLPDSTDAVIAICRNKNKPSGIWLYDICTFYQGEWEDRSNYEDVIYWMYLNDLEKLPKEDEE